MSKVLFATRLPEDKREYIRYKALNEGIEQQEMTCRIIDFYQQHDTEFMQKFDDFYKPKNEGLAHDA